MPHRTVYARAANRARQKLTEAGFSVRRPPYDNNGSGDILWVFPSETSDDQIGCIRPCTDNPGQAFVRLNISS